jgi:hypothetical protein
MEHASEFCELDMWHIAEKCLPSLISSDQEEYCIAVCTELKGQAESDSIFISTLITGDESWVFLYDPETKQQSSQWKAPTSP